jgi:Rrf2 family protein
MAMLKTGGFVRSIRGSKGGYVLARPPAQIKLREVFSALEGPVVTVECLENEDYCDQVADCIARQLWAEVQQAIEGVLNSITLQNLIDRGKDTARSDYQI